MCQPPISDLSSNRDTVTHRGCFLSRARHIAALCPAWPEMSVKPSCFLVPNQFPTVSPCGQFCSIVKAFGKDFHVSTGKTNESASPAWFLMISDNILEIVSSGAVGASLGRKLSPKVQSLSIDDNIMEIVSSGAGNPCLGLKSSPSVDSLTIDDNIMEIVSSRAGSPCLRLKSSPEVDSLLIYVQCLDFFRFPPVQCQL